MLSRPGRPLLFALLLTLGAPAPRMAAWLLGSSPASESASGRHEPQARGRNRVPAPIGATAVASRAALASGGDRAGRPRVPQGVRAHAGPARRSLHPIASPPAPAPGSTRLRC